MQWNQRFVWLNHYHHSTKLHRKQYHSLVAVGIVTHAGHSYNTDRNKLAIISSIPLYYGDTVITSNISYVTREGDYIADNWIEYKFNYSITRVQPDTIPLSPHREEYKYHITHYLGNIPTEEKYEHIPMYCLGNGSASSHTPSAISVHHNYRHICYKLQESTSIITDNYLQQQRLIFT